MKRCLEEAPPVQLTVGISIPTRSPRRGWGWAVLLSHRVHHSLVVIQWETRRYVTFGGDPPVSFERQLRMNGFSRVLLAGRTPVGPTGVTDCGAMCVWYCMMVNTSWQNGIPSQEYRYPVFDRQVLTQQIQQIRLLVEAEQVRQDEM